MTLHRVWSDKPGRYGEPVGYVTAGVSAGPLVVPTRFQEWKIERSAAGTPEDIRATVFQIKRGEAAPLTWSSVNNCTQAGASRGGNGDHATARPNLRRSATDEAVWAAREHRRLTQALDGRIAPYPQEQTW